MQDEGSARIARLEQVLDQLQAENAQLREDLDGLRFAMGALVGDTVDTFDAIERQTEAGKARLERTLGRPFTDKRLIDQLARREEVTS